MVFEFYYSFITALACSGIFHRWQKNGALTCAFTVFLLIATKIKKHHDFLGIDPFPTGYDAIRVRYMDTLLPDMTLTKDPRGPRPIIQLISRISEIHFLFLIFIPILVSL